MPAEILISIYIKKIYSRIDNAIIVNFSKINLMVLFNNK